MMEADQEPRLPPIWSEGRPTEPGLYVGFSVHPKRKWEQPSIYSFDGKVFQHWTGWYDHGVTHWIKTDVPYESGANV